MFNNKEYILLLGYILILSQFIYSGFNKILYFNKKVNILQKKTHNFFPKLISEMGMVAVIILEILGSLGLLFLVFWNIKNKNSKQNDINKKIMIGILLAFILFILLATIIYHPPSKGKMIPFMSNISIMGIFVLLIGIII